MVCAHARMRSSWREGRGHVHMTSALRERVGQNVTIVLIGCVSETMTKGEGSL